MFRSLFSRRRGVALAAATVGVASLSLAFAGTAGAATYPDNATNASLLVGSGSQTAYSTMTALGTLFNGSPGCDLTASTSTPKNVAGTLGCGTTPYANGTPDGEQGYNIAGENPYNDYTVQAPAIGSGNGASALEAAGSGTTGIAQIDYGRASALKGNATVNDVAYAIDGVSYVAFDKIADVQTALYKDKISSLTIGQIKAIWNGTETCTFGTGATAVTYNMNWNCLMNPLPTTTAKAALDSYPIDVYDAQTGSGTYSTWTGSGAADYSAGTNGLTTPGITCGACEAGWVPSGGSSGTQVSAHSNLFENQMSYIAQQPDAADAIYFMSYGKFTTTCPAAHDQQEAGTSNYKDEAVCAGTVPNTATGTAKDTYVSFGELTPSSGGAPISASEATIQDAVSGATGAFPVTRNLYNMYNNSSATDPSSQASLNFIGEDGFLCKSSTEADVDPQTGVTYRSEIEAAIRAQGFFPLDTGGSFFNEGIGTLPYPGAYTDTGYEANDVSNTFTIGGTTYVNTGASSGLGSGEGFCQVTNGLGV